MPKSAENRRYVPGTVQFASWYGIIWYGIVLLTALASPVCDLMHCGLIGDVRYFMDPFTLFGEHIVYRLTNSNLPLITAAMALIVQLCLLISRFGASIWLLRRKTWAFWLCLVLATLFAGVGFISLLQTELIGLTNRLVWSITGPAFVCECITIGALLSESSRQHFSIRRTEGSED